MKPDNDEYESGPSMKETEKLYLVSEVMEKLYNIKESAETLLRELNDHHPDAACTFQARTLDHHLEAYDNFIKTMVEKNDLL